MLEEKNDNLHEADGNGANESQEVTIAENQEIPVDAQEENEAVQDAAVEAAEVETVGGETEQAPVQEVVSEEPEQKVAVLTEELTEDELEVAAEKEALVEETVEAVGISEENEEEEEEEEEEDILTDEVADESPVIEPNDSEPAQQSDNQSVISAIEEVNAEESEDETLKERHDIPMLDYDTLSMEELVDELAVLVSVEKLMSVKDHVEELKKSFLSKYYHFIDEKKEEFHAENPDTTEDFHYHFPLKLKFDQLYSQYREKKNNHFQSLQNSLKSNLENRLAIVEELKNLIHSQDSIPVTLKKFNDIRDRWKVAGPIPKDKYNHVWNNYHFHLENFYDVLHLDREIRDLDFKHNLVQKLKIIERVEELVKEEDVNKAFRELQDLHRIWKEDIGPVSRENREEIWNRFSELTKQMHDKREGLFEQLREVEKANLERKKEIIAQIEV
jgi:hypothetical protein